MGSPPSNLRWSEASAGVLRTLVERPNRKILRVLRLMDKILHYFKYPKLWELWYIPYDGSCRILSINRIIGN